MTLHNYQVGSLCASRLPAHSTAVAPPLPEQSEDPYSASKAQNYRCSDSKAAQKLPQVGFTHGVVHMELASYSQVTFMPGPTYRDMLAVADTFQTCQSDMSERTLLFSSWGKLRPLYLYCMPWVKKEWVCG